MKASEIKGKPVITTQGENIGMVEDVLLRSVEQRLGALVVKSPRFAGPQILLAEDISSFGGMRCRPRAPRSSKIGRASVSLPRW